MHLRKFIILLILLIVGLFFIYLFSSEKSFDKSSFTWLKYENAEVGFSISYPDFYTYNNIQSTSTESDDVKDIVYFEPNIKIKSPYFNNKKYIELLSITQLKKMGDASSLNTLLNRIESECKKSCLRFSGVKDIILSGRSGKYVEYSINEDDSEVGVNTYKVVYVPIKDSVLEIMFSDVASEFPHSVQVAEYMLNTLDFKNI